MKSYGVFVESTSCARKFRIILSKNLVKIMKLKHDGASWSIITMSRNTTHTHKRMNPTAAEDREQASPSPFDGATPSARPRGNLPPRVFLLTSCSSIPTGRCRQATPRKQQHQLHDGVAHGSRAIHRGQGVSIKPFVGHLPLSDRKMV